MGHYHDVMKETGAAGLDLRKHIPAVYSGFSEMHKAAMEPGEV
ncbi:MAG: carboxymuconolactone decarboxylase family protein, partial [Actinobacteria bacterium]